MLNYRKYQLLYLSLCLFFITEASSNIISWALISQHLTDETDIIRLSHTCRLIRAATQMAIAWQGVEKKYLWHPGKAQRLIKILQDCKGKKRIIIHSDAGEFSHLKETYIREKASEIEDLERFSYYILYFTPLAYAKLKVENEIIEQAKLNQF